MTAWRDLPGDPATGLLLIADHASARVPVGIDLGVAAAVMDEHVAIDIGVAPLAAALCTRLGCPAILGDVSRLVIDLNRDEDDAGLIPRRSDGRDIPGNVPACAGMRSDRIARWWRPYHAHVAARIAADRPAMLISLHSFTPALRDGGAPRPWQIGILYNRDDRAARQAMSLLAADDVIVGDNEPYSGRLLNATMNRHGEANGIPYLGIEVRQDLIGDAAGVAHWSVRLAPAILAVRDGLKAHAPG